MLFRAVIFFKIMESGIIPPLLQVFEMYYLLPNKTLADGTEKTAKNMKIKSLYNSKYINL